MKIIAILGIWAFSLSIAFSATLKVPGEYATIQAAIDVVSDGDRIVVAPGIYEENIDFSGTNFVLTSQDPNDPEIVCATILKPGLTETTEGPRGSIAYKPSGPVVQFTSGEIPDAVLTGFTIMGGKGIAKVHEDNGDEEFYGGGIYCVGASPSIVGNMIIWNGIPDDRDRPVFGGGILCRDSEALITRNTIAYNYATEGAGILVRLGQPIITQNHIMVNEAVWSGGGIACWNSEALITRNIIMNNYAVVGGGIVLNQGYLTCNVIENNRASEGGGIVLQGTGTVIHNTVVANSADWGGNLSIHSSQYNSQPSQVLNNIIAWANMGGGVLWYDQGEGLSEGLVIQFNAIWQSNKDEAFQRLLWSDQDGTWVAPVSDIWDIHGNIYAEPGFVDRINGDYHLRPDSPCINTGDPQYEPFAGQTDMDGEERIYSYRTDIGADEFAGHILPAAHAGEDQHIAEPNTWITLDGSESRVQDPYTSLLFSWEQISGPNVELIAADSAQTQFIPTIDGTYDFELVVSDNQEYSNSDTVTISVGPEATRAAWVLWPQTDLGNGHAYQAVRSPKSVTWDSGNVMSALAGGYLATLTSPEENIFVLDLVNDVDRYWTATSCVARAGPWLGGYQLPGSQNPGEGWVWITGESFDYQAWCSGEPSGTHKGINENRLQFFSKNGYPSPVWNDAYSGPYDRKVQIAYITEYDPIDWQAEQATLIQEGDIADTQTGYTGNGYVALSKAGNSSIQWDIILGHWGPRHVSFRYAQNTGESIEMSLQINDVVLPEPLILPDTGGWDHWAIVSVPICFQPGMNHLILSSKNPGSKLNLDQLAFADENTNLALNKSINFPNHLGRQTSANAVDGDHYSIWNANGFPQWIEIDLEDDYSIRRLQLVWHDDSIYHYQIEAKPSLNGEYTTVVDATQNTKPGTFWTPLIHDIDPVSARYTRLTILGKIEGSSDPDAMGLVEFRVNASIDTPSVCPEPSESEDPDDVRR